MNFGHIFKNPYLLKEALTHSSYAHENKGCKDNERLEFIGDSVLRLLAASACFNTDMSEGEMSKWCSWRTCNKALSQYGDAKRVKLFVGKGQTVITDQMIANAVEALIGAAYLDGGLEAAKSVYNYFDISNFKLDSESDPKTALQEKTQDFNKTTPKYEVVGHFGPDHNRTYTVRLIWREHNILGKSSTINGAESIAALNALRTIFG